ncbi:MAG: hypothetical protein NTY14_03430 [Candidatus Omnitrophica bacterium]|nr:hypothetical protein [Candidatus Omnitrophota bacterium]
MRRMIICVLFCSAITGARAFSAEVSDIYLDDGSFLRAEVVSLQNGKYTLRSPSMGEFTIDASRISQIEHRTVERPAVQAETAQVQQQPFGSPEAFQAKVASTQTAVMNDPEAMKAIISMASDPEFQKLFEDPEAVAALKSGDMATLMKKPGFQAIMNNPKMQAFANQMKDKIK